MYNEILIQFLLAAICGGVIGAEREYRSKSAGFRTMIMIAVGACLFTVLSVQIGGKGNPDRIASNIVTGIGFLGAGVIFRGDNRVNGITTAASIWAVSALGMGIGAGYYFASVCACVLIVIVLAVLPYLETLIDRLNQSKEYIIQCNFAPGIRQHFEEIFRRYGLRFKIISEIKESDKLHITWLAQGHANSHLQFMDAIIKDELAQRVEY